VRGEGSFTVLSGDEMAFRLSNRWIPAEDALEAWRKFAEWQPDLLVDVGASYGRFTRAVESVGSRVWAIEPNAAVAECLRTTFQDVRDVQVFELAIGAESHVTRAFSPGRYNSGFGSVFPMAHEHSSERGHVEVQQMRLDDLIEDHGLTPSSILLKIDAEGAETEVLSSILPVLTRCVWWRAVVEWNPSVVAHLSEPAKVWSATYQPWALSHHVPPTETCEVILGHGAPP
jgi:FkbM family methyltransferase